MCKYFFDIIPSEPNSFFLPEFVPPCVLYRCSELHVCLGPRPKTNPSADHFQYHVWGVIYVLNEV